MTQQLTVSYDAIVGCKQWRYDRLYAITLQWTVSYDAKVGCKQWLYSGLYTITLQGNVSYVAILGWISSLYAGFEAHQQTRELRSKSRYIYLAESKPSTSRPTLYKLKRHNLPLMFPQHSSIYPEKLIWCCETWLKLPHMTDVTTKLSSSKN